MTDLTEQMRRHVASYKTLTNHRQACLDMCDEIERLTKCYAAAKVTIDRFRKQLGENDERMAHVQVHIAELEAEIERLTAECNKQGKLANELSIVLEANRQRVAELEANGIKCSVSSATPCRSLHSGVRRSKLVAEITIRKPTAKRGQYCHHCAVRECYYPACEDVSKARQQGATEEDIEAAIKNSDWYRVKANG